MWFVRVSDDNRRYLKKYVLEDLEQAGEIEKVRVLRGKMTENGTKQYYIVSRGKAKTALPVDLALAQKETWLWRVRPRIPREELPEGMKPPTILPDTPPELKLETEDAAAPVILGPDGWEGRLRFKNVPDIDMRFPSRRRRYDKDSFLDQEEEADFPEHPNKLQKSKGGKRLSRRS